MYRDLGADKNLTNTAPPSTFSFFEYLEREGGEQTGLSFDLKSSGVFCSLHFLEVEVGKDSWQINDRDPGIMMNEIV